MVVSYKTAVNWYEKCLDDIQKEIIKNKIERESIHIVSLENYTDQFDELKKTDKWFTLVQLAMNVGFRGRMTGSMVDWVRDDNDNHVMYCVAQEIYDIVRKEGYTEPIHIDLYKDYKIFKFPKLDDIVLDDYLETMREYSLVVSGFYNYNEKMGQIDNIINVLQAESKKLKEITGFDIDVSYQRWVFDKKDWRQPISEVNK